MLEEKWPNNSVELCGTLRGRPEYSHSSREEEYYIFMLDVERLSGTVDTIKIVARESTMSELIIEEREKVIIKGELRSFNNKSGIGNRLIITVFAQVIELGYGEDRNEVVLCGIVCKLPNLRRTPMGREICDMMLAVNRRYGRSDYIPCIAWGQNAQLAGQWHIGSVIQLTGRIQSRKYIKINDGQSEEKTVYEVSATTAELINNDE